MTLPTPDRGTSLCSLRSCCHGGAGQENILTMQALAARFRAHAAETSLEIFRCKFEAAAEELERLAGTRLIKLASFRGSPDKGNDPGYGH